jgi:hypothetical protein
VHDFISVVKLLLENASEKKIGLKQKSITKVYIATFLIPYLKQYMASVEAPAPSK